MFDKMVFDPSLRINASHFEPDFWVSWIWEYIQSMCTSVSFACYLTFSDNLK